MRADGTVLTDHGTHVFCQDFHSPRPALAGSQQENPTRLAIRQILRDRRRVGILTLGFWPSQAGMELMIHNLAVHLTYAGDMVTLYAPKPKKSYVEIPHNYLLKRFRDEQHFCGMFRQQHAVLPFDVLLVQGGLEAASMALALKRELRVPVILRTHGEDIQIDESTGYGYRLDPTKRAIIDRNINLVDKHVVIGEHISPLVREIAPHADIETIHNGVDVERFRPQSSRYVRERLSLSDDKLVMLTVGRNVKKKAFHLAIEALALILPRVPHAVLVHAGRDGNGEDLLEVARRCGVAHAFYRLGEVDYFDTPAIYASADLFVFPSKVETFGNVTVEALASGLPCVEFDYSVNRQKIASGRNGYIVPFGNVGELADRCVELLTDTDKRRAFSLEARLAAEASFAWPRVAERYRSIFQQFRAVQTQRTIPVTGYGSAPFYDSAEAP
jgi:glycosyltransferase involved in cell wall biosynthesis